MMPETINIEDLLATLGAYAYRSAAAERQALQLRQDLSIAQQALREARAELDAIHHPRATA